MITRELATHQGWVASVYLDVSRNRGGAPHEVRLRWEALAERPREQGAADKTVDAAGDAALRPIPNREFTTQVMSRRARRTPIR